MTMDEKLRRAAAELPPLTDAQMDAVKEIYDRLLHEESHPQW